MNISFYNGVSGMVTYQQDLNTIAHNLANVNTIGYKAVKSQFENLMATHMAVNGDNDFMVGHGVKSDKVDLLMGQGSFQPTDFQLDFAIAGDGFFAVETEGGTVEYTRNGAMNIGIEEDGRGFLTDSQGAYVLDALGQRIELPHLKDEDDKDTDRFDLTGLADKIGVYDFPNPYGLESRDASRFRATPVSGEAAALNIPVETDGKKGGNRANRNEEETLPPYTSTYKVLPGMLENSGANLADEMVNMIVAQKAYTLNARMVKTADELEEVLNGLR